MAQRFKALSNPHRLAILVRLAGACRPNEPCCPVDEMTSCVGELVHDLEIAPSTVSHHLKELRHAGLIRTERHGQYVHCWVDRDALTEIMQFFNGLPLSLAAVLESTAS